MISTKSVGVLAGLLCLLLWPAHTVAQQADWERHMRAGEAAYYQGNYAEAVKQTKAALSLAETFGPNDPRLASTLNNLAQFYYVQGDYAEVEPLYERALAIVENVFGPGDPHLAAILHNLAELDRAQGRYDEAKPLLYQRALAIQEKALGPPCSSINTFAVLIVARVLRLIGRA